MPKVEIDFAIFHRDATANFPLETILPNFVIWYGIFLGVIQVFGIITSHEFVHRELDFWNYSKSNLELIHFQSTNQKLSNLSQQELNLGRIAAISHAIAPPKLPPITAKT